MITIAFAVAMTAFFPVRVLVDHEIATPYRQAIGRWCRAKKSRVRQKIAYLMTCPHCLGFWFTWPTALIVSTHLRDAHWIEHLVTVGAAVGIDDLAHYLANQSKAVAKVPEELEQMEHSAGE